MNRIASVCRILRDFGIFLLGLAAIVVAVDYVFVHPDPLRRIQTTFLEDFSKSFNTRHVSDDKKEAPEEKKHLSGDAAGQPQ